MQNLELNTNEVLLLKSLIIFYGDSKNWEILLRFLKGTQRRLSLHLLDWLVTIYSKNHDVIIQDKLENMNNVEFMYLACKNHLKSYSKIFFDAFARCQRIFYTLIIMSTKFETRKGIVNLKMVSLPR